MAASRNYTEVIIDGKVFTLSGFESEEYLQKVSNYLNHKIAECSENESYKKQSSDTKSILLALNIADDYFKAKEQERTALLRTITDEPLLIRRLLQHKKELTEDFVQHFLTHTVKKVYFRDRKSTRLNSSHSRASRMPSSA